MLAFFAKEWKEERLYITGLSAEEKQEIKKSRRRHSLSFTFSCVLHGLLFFGFYKGIFTPLKQGPVWDLETGAVDFELAEGMISSEMPPVYDSTSDIIIKPALLLKEKKKDERAEALKALLQELRSGKNPVISSSVFKKTSESARLEWEERQFKAGSLLSVKKKKKRKPFKAQLWSKMNVSKPLVSSSSVSSSPVNRNNLDIMKVIDGHSFQFRNCYERALLKDESLSVKVVFLLKLNGARVKTTRLEVKGKGSARSRRLLSHCLFSESKKLNFVNNKQNISLKFNLIFGL